MISGKNWRRTVVAMTIVGAATSAVSAQDCQPEIIGSIGGLARDVAVVGTTAYVANEASGLLTVDVSDPTNPTIIGNAGVSGLPMDVAVSGNVAYVANRNLGLQVIDVSDPTNPAVIGSSARTSVKACTRFCTSPGGISPC